MKILVINSGSSSLKFKLFESKGWKQIYSGHIDKIGLTKGKIKNHTQALEYGLTTLIDSNILKDLNEIKAVGHRVVHGGEKYYLPTLINKKVIKEIKKLSELAPLHNPPNLEGIIACQKSIPKAKNIAIFDTAFHHTLEPKAFHYAIPQKFYQKDNIRRYGFHGTSHKYVSSQFKKGKVISCHIGNGSSICAIKNGKSIDTSMGFTPLEGIPMGTRSGDLDPAIVFYLMEHKKYTPEKIDHLLNHESGLEGLSGISSDMRVLWDKYQKKNQKAILTLDLLSYRIAKYIGAYTASLNGLDTLIFTAGLGENAWYLRENICNYLKFLGLKLAPTKNKATTYRPLNKSIKDPSKLTVISDSKSKVKVIVIPTNEELQIARETFGTL